MRFLFISTLFPNSVNPTRALYNLRHLSALRDLGHIVDVIAPVPWFPGLRLLGRKYPPERDVFEGFDVKHPRFWAPPKVLVQKHHLFYRRSVAPLLKAETRHQKPEVNGRDSCENAESSVVNRKKQAGFHQSPTTCENPTASSQIPDARAPGSFSPGPRPAPNQRSTINNQLVPHEVHIILGFAYPDAVAMAPVCDDLALNYSIFVLGSDFRVRTKQPKFKANVMATLRQAPAIFCPGQALRNDMAAAGVKACHIHHFNNGVDQAVFHP